MLKIGAIVKKKCVGITQCKDGTYSTLPADARGVCSYHGGPVRATRARVIVEETNEAVDVVEVSDANTGEVIDMELVPTLGVYQFTTYTTQKGKTKPAIAVIFEKKPQREVLDVLKQKVNGRSLFWYQEKTFTWFAWESPQALEIVESLPLSREGEVVPIVPADRILDEVDKVKLSNESVENVIPSRFPIFQPKRGKYYSQDEYGKLRQLIRIQSYIRTLRPELEALRFTVFTNLLQDIKDWQTSIINSIGEDMYKKLFRSEYNPIRNVNDLQSLANHHPYGRLEYSLEYLSDRFINRHNIHTYKFFNEKKNRTYENVQTYFNDKLSEIVEEIYKQIEYLSQDWIYRKSTDPQGKIDKLKNNSTYDFNKRVLRFVDKTAIDIPFGTKYEGRILEERTIYTGDIRLSEVDKLINLQNTLNVNKKQAQEQKYKESLKLIFEACKEFVKRGYRYHRPTFTRFINENLSLGRLKLERRGDQFYFRSNNVKATIASIYDEREVESILVSIHYMYNVELKDYVLKRTVKDFLDSGKSIDSLYGLSSVGAIIDPSKLPEYVTQCADGTYSTSTSNRACSHHGGVLHFDTPLPLKNSKREIDAHPAAVYLVPLEEVFFARDLFQNREHEYSEESVQRIIEAVEMGTFRMEVFDPVLLWKHEGKLFVLSGHSRTEAFTRLADLGLIEFQKIPAKVITATLDDARRIALESNTLNTRETDSERAAYYRQLLIDEVPAAEVTAAAKKNEGTNAARIMNYAYLNPNGLTMTALKALEGKDPTSQENVKNVANWTGAARRKFLDLSNLHEDEIYRWLVSGVMGRQYTNVRDFLSKIQSVIYQRTEFGRFDADIPLNLTNLGMQTSGEKEYNAQKSEIQIQIRNLDKTYKDKLKDLKSRGATSQDLERILSPIEMQLRTARLKLTDFLQNATRPRAAAKSELSLFAVAGYKTRTPYIHRSNNVYYL